MEETYQKYYGSFAGTDRTIKSQPELLTKLNNEEQSALIAGGIACV